MKYDEIGKTYDVTRKADPLLLSNLKRLLGVGKGEKVLDLACGSANYTGILAKEEGQWFGLDQSEVMLRHARQKNTTVNFARGNADALPFPNGAFDAVLVSLAIHHFESLTIAFSEVARVLGKGRFLLFTSTSEQMQGYWLNKYFPKAMSASIEQMPTADEIIGALKKAGFNEVITENYSIHPELEDFFLYKGKFKPEMYLNPSIRAGISTFSSLAAPEEIDSGCAQLAEDIDSGKIREVIDEYANDLGDYRYYLATIR